MKYKNGRVGALQDRVVVPGTGGKFIGTVVSYDGKHIQVIPVHCQNAYYFDPAVVLHVDDALVPDADVKAA